jgi:hypothetical protein
VGSPGEWIPIAAKHHIILFIPMALSYFTSIIPDIQKENKLWFLE